MFYNAPIEELEAIKERIKKDIKWYRKKNQPGVAFTDEYRNKRIAELTAQLEEYNQAISILMDESLHTR